MSSRTVSNRRASVRRVGFLALVAALSLASFPSLAQEESTTTTAPPPSSETTTTTTTAPPPSTETTTTTVAETTTTTAAETTTTAAESTTTAAETTTTTAPNGGSVVEEEVNDDAPSGSVSEDLAGALSVWNKRVREKEAELEKARAALAVAETDFETTREEVEAARVGLIELEAEILQQAVNAFTEPDTSFDYLSQQNMNDSIRMRTLLGGFVDKDFEGAEELRVAKEDLAIQQAKANRSRVAADEVAERIEAELAELEKARDMKASLTAKAADNLGVVTAADIVTVRGFEVHRDIADAVDGMLAQAESEGIVYTGGGYRSFERQVEIRKSNCGTSYYAIWQMPSSRCRPPTARPGASQHERGMALDLVCDGSLIRSRSGRCFQWLAANAENYGLYNLPSEPWHWSVNGR